MIAFVSFVLFVVGLSLNVDAAEYLWPVDLPHCISSSFGEYRSSHFHAGIDVSTLGVDGQKVFAVADGYISRIKISPFGFGKCLYQQLNDGRYAVYAHLQSISPQLKPIAEREQYRIGQYSIDLNLSEEKFPVKKGDLLGLSGHSGVSQPHLHFELRNKDDVPINPLEYGFDVADSVRPSIYQAAFEPLDEKSLVNDKCCTLTMGVSADAQNGEAKLSGTPHIEGRVGVALKVADSDDGNRGRFGPYRVETFVDDKPLFAFTHRALSYDEGRQVNLVYSYPLARSGKGEFLRLYRDEANSIDGYRQFAEDGVIDVKRLGLDPGTHRFHGTVADYSGNATQFAGTFLVDAQNQKVEGRGQNAERETHGPKPKTRNEEIGLLITRSQGGTVRSSDGKAIAEFGPRGTFHDIYAMLAESARNGGGKQKAEPWPASLKSALYRLGPDTEPLDKGCKLAIRSEAGSQGKAGIFEVKGSDLKFIGADYDAGSGYVSATVNEPAVYGLFEDKTPPVISNVHPTNGTTTASHSPRISANISDAGTGIDHTSIKVTLDGQLVICEYDPLAARIFGEPREKLADGKHTLEISVADKLKNQSKSSTEFTITSAAPQKTTPVKKRKPTPHPNTR